MSETVILNKVKSIERCLKRVREDYRNHSADFRTNFTVQDAIVLNIQRACEQSIDLANHIIKSKKLGVPQNARNSFELLAENELISESLKNNLMKMVGFRNIAIHEYQKLDMEVVEFIIENRLVDFESFSKVALDQIP